MSPSRTSDTEIAGLLSERLTGIGGYTAAECRLLVQAFHAAAAAVDVGDDLAESVLGAWWWPYRLSVLARTLNAEAGQALGWQPQVRMTWTAMSGPAQVGGLTRAETRPLLDVNTTTVTELLAVPGIGPVTARRIAGARPYRRVGQVQIAAGLSAAAWRQARPALIVDTQPIARRWAEGTPGVAEFFDAAHAGLIDLPGLPAAPDAAAPPEAPAAAEAAAARKARACAVAALLFLAGRVAAKRTRSPLWSPSPQRLQLGSRGLSARDLPEHTVAGVAPVRRGAYLPLLLALLAAATEVSITMFFVSSGPALAPVLDALAACRARGGRVRCLLADSLPGDVRGAADVNAAGHAALIDHGVEVRSWWPEVALHEKSVVVDSRHVLVGSHNWTASSFYRYDDTTLYLDSPTAGEQLTDRFERRWQMLAGDPDECVVTLAELTSLPTSAADRLAARGVRTGRDLPADRPTLRLLARNARVPVDDLAFIRDVAALMAQLRVSEITAGCLVAAGLRSADQVSSAPTAEIADAIERPRGLPEALERRPVNPAVVHRLSGRN